MRLWKNAAAFIQLYQTEIACHSKAIEHMRGCRIYIIPSEPSLFYALLNPLAAVIGALGHFHIHTLPGGQGMIGTPVAHHIALVIPHIPQHGFLGVFIGGGIGPVKLVVAAHKRAGASLFCGGFKGRKHNFVERLLIHKLVGCILHIRADGGDAKMLERRHSTGILNALCFGNSHRCGQKGVFTQHILVSVKLGNTHHVKLRAQLGVAGDRNVFAALHLAVLIGKRGIPGGSKHFLYRKTGCFIDGGDARRTVIHSDFRNTQAGNPGIVACVCHLHAVGIAVSMAESELFLRRHGCKQGMNLFG